MANTNRAREFDFYPLEDRILLSGEGIDGSELTIDADADVSASLLAELTADGQATGDPAVAAAPTTAATGEQDTDANDLAEAPTFDPALPLEVVFVDAGVEDAQTLLDGLRGDGENETQWLVVQLSADQDGVAQITQTLSELNAVDAIHILSHGDGQGIQLGNMRLDVDTADGYVGDIASWASSLDADADLLIYGCDLASTVDGRSLIQSMGALCDCDVAASDDTTGHSSLGGDWDLEYQIGEIESEIAFSFDAQQSWEHVLAVSPDATSTGTTSGASATVSHTTSAASDGLMLVGITSRTNASETVSSVTYNGIGLSFVGAQDAPTGARVEIWSLITPDAGTHDVVVNMSAATHGGVTVGVTTFSGVDQTTPLGTFASASGDANNGSATVSSAVDEYVFGVVAVKDTDQNLVPGAGQTELWDLFTGSEANGGGSTEAGAASVDMSWTWSAGTDWAIGGVSIKAVSPTVINFTIDATPSISEDLAETATFNVTLGGDALTGGNTASVDIAASGTGISGTDYDNFITSINTTAASTAGVTFDGTDTLTFDSTFNGGSGQGSFAFTVDAIDDAEVEGTETIVATLSNATATSGTATLATFSDSFTEAGNTNITAHAPDSGSTWTQYFNDSTYGEAFIDAALDIVKGGSGTSQNDTGQAYAAGPDPTGVDQTISFTLSAIETDSGTKPVGLFGRSADINNFYYLRVLPNGNAQDSVSLWKMEGGTPTLLASIDVTIADGDTFALEITDGAKKVYHNAAEVLSSADNALTAAGKWGFFLGDFNGVGGHYRNTWNIDNFLADDSSAVVTATTDITETDVNNSPTIATNTGTTVLEGSTATAITTAMLNEGDPDDSGAGLTYTVTNVTDNGTMYLAGFGALGLNDTFTQADIDAGDVTYDHNGSETATDSFDFSLADGGEDGATPATGTFNITVTPVNDNNPIITSDGGGATAAINTFENGLYVSTVSATDADLPAETLTYSITGGLDSTKFAIDSSTGVLTFVSAPDFESPTDNGGNNIYDVIVQVSDGTLTDTQAVAVTVTDVADSGQYLDLFNLDAYSNSDGTEAWGTGWVDSGDADPSSGNIKVSGGELRITPNSVNENIYREVNLSTAVSASYDFSYINSMTGDRTILVQISGNGGVSYDTLAVMDATTNTGTGTLSLDISSYTAADTRVRFIVSAIGGGGPGGNVKIDNLQVSYTANTSPTITSDGGAASASVNVAENSAAVTTVTAVDGDVPAQTLTYSIVGGVDSTKFAIDSGSGALTFIATPNRESPTDVGADNVYDVIVQVSDGIATDTQAIAVSVTDVDEFDVITPTDSDAAVNTVDENAATNTVVGVTAFASDADDTNNTITYSLTDTAGGRFKIDSVSGVVTVDNGTLLNREAAASHNIIVRADSSDGSFDTAGMTININDVDEFDVGAVTDADATANAVDENAIVGTTVGITASASDADATTNGITYTLQDNDGGRFAIDGSTGIVTVAGAIDRETDGASRNITVRATSADGSFTDQVMAININDIDEFDVGAVTDSNATANAVDENAIVGTAVGITGSASDADATTNAITYTLQDNDGGRFTIDGSTGIVTVAGAIDREADGASRNITVRATSADGSFTDQIMAININDVDEFDVGAVTDSNATANAVDENAANGTVVGVTALASDADATNNTITYTLDDNAGGRFTIDGSTGIVTVADGTLLDREAAASHDITVRAASSDGSSSTAVMTINLNDVDEFDVGAVTDSNATANAVDENAANGTVVGVTALASDADATNNTITYTLDDNAGGRFTIDGSTGIVTVADGTLLDREAAASHDITVRAASSDGSSNTAVMTINLNDVDEFDVGAVTDSNATANAVDENAANGTVVGVTALASDADATNNTITYTLDDNAGGRFTIDGSTGIVTVADGTLLDREAAASHDITVRAASSDGSSNTAVMTVNLNDVDEFDVGAVTDSNATANAVDENAANGTVVGVTALASDADATNNTITYTLDDNAGGRFTIDGSTGIVTVADGTLLDREAAASHDITVRAASSDGSSNTAVMTVNLNDVDEFDVGAVTDSNATANAVDENAANGTVVGVTALANDADATNNTITYTLDDNAGGRFTIDGSTGIVTVADGTLLDREAAASHDITVRAASSDGSSNTAVMTINLNDVDEFDVGAVTDSNATANAVDENAANGTVVGVTALASDADATNNTITYTLDDNAGGRFAIDGSTGIVTVADGTLLDREAAASHDITVRAASSDGSSNTTVMTINLNDVDEFDVTVPIDSNATTNAVDENAATNTVVGITALATDNDATNNTITYSLDDTAGGRFKIDSVSGVVTVDNGILLDREAAASHNITVRADSSDGSFDTAMMTINVNDVDEFDVGPVSDTDGALEEVDENAAIGTAVGITASASDADATNNTITYTLFDNDGGRFKIDAVSGVVTVDGVIDREADGASRNIIVRATSSDGSSTDQGYSININDVDEFDVSTPADSDVAVNAVDENAATNTVVGVTALASDADATNNTISYSLDDTAGGRFKIDSVSGVVTVDNGTLLDREAAASHNITVRADSSDGSSDTAVMIINLNDVDEFDVGVVSDNDVASNAVAENAATNTVVGVTALASDADATNNTITYTLDDTAGGRFKIDSVSGVVTVDNGGLLDREVSASHDITVRASSSDGSSNTALMTINVNDVDEFNVGPISDIDGATEQVDENAAIGTLVGITASASDADATNNTITYTLFDNDGGRFKIDSVSGVVTVDGAIDREADGAVRNIVVRATSSDGSSTDQGYSININDVDEFDTSATVDSDAALNSVNENAAIGTTVGVTAAASDADATNNTITYTLDDNDGGRFDIDPNTGIVTVAGGIDREADGPTRSITVRSTSSDGSSTTESFVINVGDVDEFDATATVDVDGAVNEVDENAAIGTTVGITASSSDADATTNTISYTLDDNDGGRFMVDSSTGVVTVSGAIDREADGPSRNIIVRSTSLDGSFTTQSFAIAINDVDEFDVSTPSDSDAAPNFVNENSAFGTTVGLTAFAADADATDSVTYSLDDNAGGRFAIDGSTGLVTVSGALDFETASSHNVTVRGTSTDGSTATQVFTINVGDVNEAPVASGDTYAMNAGNTLNVATPGVISNDTDVDGDSLTTVLVSGPSNGSLTLLANGSLSYTPAAGFFGNDSFFYQVSDGALLSNVVEVQVSVAAGAPDPPAPDPEPEPEPEPEPDPEPDPEPEPDPDPEPEEDPLDEPVSETPPTGVIPPVTGSAFERAMLLATSSDEAAGMTMSREDDMSIESAFAGLFSNDRLEFGSQRYSPQAEMLERLLQLDLEQAIVWQSWDQTRDSLENSSVSFVVGSAGTAAGMFSIGYVVWALRGGAFVTAMSSAVPAWRIVDPTTLLTAYRTARSPGDAVENMLG